MVHIYPGLFNSSYHPSPVERLFINTPANQLGPPLLGQMFLTLLQGMMFVQYHEYIGYFWNEKRWTKWLVHVATFLCTVKTIYIWGFTWDRFVPHYGDWLYLSIFTPISVAIGISSTLPSAVCQIFYIYRCWALSHNWLFVIPAVASLLVTVGSGIVLTIGSAIAAGGVLKGFGTVILISANVTLASGLICDLFITTFTCYYLVRNKTGFKQTDNMVFSLVKYSIESAAGPSMVALANLILTNQSTNNQWFLFPSIILSHVYGCSLLYTVNARRNVSEAFTTVVSGSLVSATGGARLSRIGTRGGMVASTKNHHTMSLPWRVGRNRTQEQTPPSMSGVLVEIQTIRDGDSITNMGGGLKEAAGY